MVFNVKKLPVVIYAHPVTGKNVPRNYHPRLLHPDKLGKVPDHFLTYYSDQ